MSRANANPTADGITWHAMAVDEVVRRLTTDIKKGLDAAEAANRLQKYGPNRLPEGKKRGPFMRFLSQFNNVLVYVLLAPGFTKLMLNLWVDASIIFGVVILNALLGFIQEGKAEKALESIRSMLSAEARTLRGGETRMIPAEELVPGDIALLESGDKIPADLRLADAKNLRTEEAALTGESVPADKNTDPVTANATVGDRECMAFSGTMVVSGRAMGVVVATGSETELGRINQLLAGVSALETPLLRQIKKFGYAITAVIAVVGALVFAYGKWVKGMDFVELFQAVVGIAVSVIPEGLPAIITITLAIGVQRMAQRNAIVRRLPAVETLGSVSRICSDKTGTLTLMEMMVVSAVTAESAYQVTGNGYAPEGEVKKDGKPAGKEPVLDLMGRVSMLCNDAELFEEDGAWKVEGDPTEGALYPFARKLGMDRQTEQAACPRIDAIPFESEHKFMATLHKSADGKELLFAKGAPEVILEHCDRQETAGGQPRPLDRERFMSCLRQARRSGRARAGAASTICCASHSAVGCRVTANQSSCRRPWPTTRKANRHSNVRVGTTPWDAAPTYLVRDNDGAYGQAFTSRIRAMGIRDRPISPRSPWQNPYVERLIGTLRRDCLDHILIYGERHLRRVLTSYSLYYNETRTHLGLGKDAPLRRAVRRSGTITVTPILSGLHHRYARI
jgi:magnesium-transporting ATPase (P-type)